MYLVDLFSLPYEDKHLEFQASWPALAMFIKRQLLHDEVMVEIVRYCHFIYCQIFE